MTEALPVPGVPLHDAGQLTGMEGQNDMKWDIHESSARQTHENH